MIGKCKLCGVTSGCEVHHVIFRSQATYMRTIKVNLAKLCVECHRGTQGVHNNKKADLKLKVKLQHELTSMFEKKYYTKDEIREILDCSDFDAVLICKRMCMHSGNYKVDELIKRMLGGRFYG